MKEKTAVSGSVARLLRKQDSILLIMGMQKKFLQISPKPDVLIGNVAILVKLAKLFSMPIFVSEHFKEGFGLTVPDIRRSLPEGTRFFDEITFGCQGIIEELKALKRHQIILCGFGAHIGANHAAHQLLDQGFQVHLMQDALMSRSPEYSSVAMEKMRQAGAIANCVEMAAFELLENADNPEIRDAFKTLFSIDLKQ